LKIIKLKENGSYYPKEIERLKAVILDMKMFATNTLTEIWLIPDLTQEQKYHILMEAMEIIQHKGNICV
jgi:hypothetical protein